MSVHVNINTGAGAMNHSQILARACTLFLRAFYLLLIILLAAACMALPAVGQDVTVSGTVTNAESGEPLPGVNVVVQGTTIGTATDAQGRYSLSVPSLQDTLVFSFVGYEAQEVPIAGRTQIDVTLTRSVLRGEEVVVIGYGTTTQADLTGAVASLDVADVEAGPVYSVDQLIQGKVPGVRTVFSGGRPGSSAAISIRGASSISAGTGPLIVVDGLPSNVPVNPSDIKSIEILKGPSATAIYGARGGNGVILITTKSGRAGDLRVTYNGKVGVQTPSNTLDVLTPQAYQRVLNEIIEDGGGNPEQRVEGIAGDGTNWQEQVLRPALVQNHDLSFSGGSEATQYYVSLGAFLQDGIVVSSAFERYMARVNIDHEVTDEFRFGLRLNAHYRMDDYIRSTFQTNILAGPLYAAYYYDPTLPTRNEDGEYIVSPFIAAENPLAAAYGYNRKAISYRTYGTFFAEYFLLPSLSVNLRVGADLFSRRQDRYVNRLTQIGRGNGGIAEIDESQNREYLIEGTATYDERFGVHDLNVLAGVTAQRFVNESVSTYAAGFPSDVIGTKNLGFADPETFESDSFTSIHQLLSFIGRVNYSLMDKYLLTATMRVDGSSRFGANNRFGYFPSLALAWRLDQEDFIEDLGFVSTLKLRAGFGLTGNQAIGNYASLVTFGEGAAVAWGDQKISTTSPARFGNPNLKWETTRQLDIGLDYGFFGGRISGTIDYWRKDTYDMLLALPVPRSTGYFNQLTNIGSIQNSGFEFSLSTRNLVGDFTWTTDLNFATLSNEVTSLGPISEIITGRAGFLRQISIIKPGLPLRTYYGYEIVGIWQEGDDYSQTTENVQPGSIKYRDVNDDGAITAADRVPLGDSFPDLTWSIGNTFSYKNLSLYVFVQGIQGVSMINNVVVNTYFPTNFRRNRLAEPLLNRWTPENPSSKYPSFLNPLSQGRNGVNSYTVQDASYARLQTVRLSYEVPPVSDLYRSLTLFVTGQNLFTLTNYDGVDPAVNPNSNANFRIDYNVYPSTTTYTLGLRLGF